MIINRLKAAYLAFKNPAAIYDGLLMQDMARGIEKSHAQMIDAVAYGTGFTQNGERINPRDVWNMETPVYTLEDIGWKSYGSG